MGSRILILHSDLDTLRSLGDVLLKNGFSVSTVSKVNDCLGKLKEEKPDLLLVESFMPREKILKEVQKLGKTKVLYLLSDDCDKSEIVLYENVMGFVDEPFEVKKFVQKIKDVLK